MSKKMETKEERREIQPYGGPAEAFEAPISLFLGSNDRLRTLKNLPLLAWDGFQTLRSGQNRAVS